MRRLLGQMFPHKPLQMLELPAPRVVALPALLDRYLDEACLVDVPAPGGVGAFKHRSQKQLHIVGRLHTFAPWRPRLPM